MASIARSQNSFGAPLKRVSGGRRYKTNVRPADDILLSIFPTAAGPSLTWYKYWLPYQVQSFQHDLSNSFASTPFESTDSLFSKDSNIMKAFCEIARLAKCDDASTLELISRAVRELDIFSKGTESDHNLQQFLVFTFLGWQTMLWAPSFTPSFDELIVQDPLIGVKATKIINKSQNQRDAKLPLFRFLYGFGQLLPAPPKKDVYDVERGTPAKHSEMVTPRDLNWFLLSRIGSVTITWIDTMAEHLTFDSGNRVLYLFRYPSFAARCMGELSEDGERSTDSVLHACAAPVKNTTDWPCADDVTQLLQEILLSYRLLFGQLKISRKEFRSLSPFNGLPKSLKDPFLKELCSRKSPDISQWIEEKDQYYLSDDFPMLSEQVLALHRFLAKHNPRGWRQVWRNRQYTEEWYAFWAILFIGIIGVVLSLISTVLQAFQLYLSYKARRT